MKVEFSAEAADDLDAIYEHIAVDDPVAAASWTERLIQRAESVAKLPRRGRVVPELGDPQVREIFLGNYRVIYRVETARIIVLTIIEGHRRLSIDE